ncbi:MAG: Uma2 family endonuclease [Chloroflexi bacterium]|nr:Uma2 family endonuclease [Chloroflexota bacterium]
MTWEEFHDGWDKEERRTEWVDGVLISVSPENIRHLLQTAFLADLIKSRVRPNKLGIVITSNFIMRLRSRPSGRMPDILFVANEHLDRVKDTYLDGPADIAIEVVSPESRGRDRTEKLAEYEAAGVPEYWIIDESRTEALFYVLDDAGQYTLIAPSADGVYTSAVLPSLQLRVSWLWQWPLPDLEDALADLPA